MSEYQDLHVSGAVGAALQALGWPAEAPELREVAPTAARGHNLIVVVPPAPVYATPALAGLLSRLPQAGRALLLCPAAELDAWGAAARTLAADTAIRIEVAHGTARALRRLAAGEVDLLVAAPETALALQRRATLKLDALAAVLFAWPERWEADEAVTQLMADLPREAQRLVLTADAARVAELGERFARKALVVGTPPAEMPAPAPLGPVRTVSVGWSRRETALAALLEVLDPASLTVWARDRSADPAIRRALPGGDPAIRLVTGNDVPAAQFVVAWDPPSHEQLARLLAAGEVILLVPPGAEAYVARITTVRRPLRLPGLLDTVADEAARRRQQVLQTMEEGRPAAALAALAPLFERHDATAVAAALYELWTAAGTPAAAAAPPAQAAGTARIYVSVGKRDGVTPNDLVAVLTKEVRVDRARIGRIELRDSYSLVELPADEAERIAGAMTGASIRRKRVTARVDRGPARAAERGTGRPVTRPRPRG